MGKESLEVMKRKSEIETFKLKAKNLLYAQKTYENSLKEIFKEADFEDLNTQDKERIESYVCGFIWEVLCYLNYKLTDFTCSYTPYTETNQNGLDLEFNTTIGIIHIKLIFDATWEFIGNAFRFSSPPKFISYSFNKFNLEAIREVLEDGLTYLAR